MEVAVHDTIDRNDRQVETEHAEMSPKRQELRWELHGVQRGHFREDLGERNENFILCLRQFKEGLQFAGFGFSPHPPPKKISLLTKPNLLPTWELYNLIVGL